MTYLLFSLGFVILIFGANWLVSGASSLAKRLNVSDLVIGLTIVAFGTSTPELVVSLRASFSGSTDIAVGNVVGSNIFNYLFILGLAAVLYPVNAQKNTVWKEIPLALLAAIVLAFIVNDGFLSGGQARSEVSRGDGLVLLCFFGIFMYYIIDMARNDPSPSEEVAVMPVWKSLLFLGLGLAGLVVGGGWIVDGAIALARLVGMSEAVIGLTIVAAGTSLPELATSAVAAYKKNSDIAMGNVVGSNIFNSFFILGTSAAITPLPFRESMNLDVLTNVVVSAMVFIFLFVGRGRRIDRWEGSLFILVYVIYVAYLIYHQ
ncbi:MAG: calcium/sodium antiporter [Bernardetiaceae bacterium]|jgi:cation:H+ antiporter|nr:calcium/sodium antiporter [Bernardetiaceae bacterium]